MKTVPDYKAFITSKAETVKGFRWQAEQKVSEAKIYLETGKKIKGKLDSVRNVEDILEDPELYDFFISACFLSRKSLSHISRQEQELIISQLIDISLLKDESYKSEIIARYFMTSGDSLGGTMRNKVGQFAQNLLSAFVIKKLNNKKIPYRLHQSTKDKVTSIDWEARRLVFDKKPKFINKSVDFILLADVDPSSPLNLEDPNRFIACGELKGGIDPAGADEHWKTAKSALDRIKYTFEANEKLPSPKLFFIGAAIENAMAVEIFHLLESGWLSGAANLLDEKQLDELVENLISL